MLLMDLRTGEWDGGLCELFGIPRIMLPEIRPTLADFGEIESGETRLSVLASIGDQQAAALGQGGAFRGDLCLNYGTGAFALFYTGHRLMRRKGLLSNIAWSTADKRTYVLEGGVNGVGSGLRWLSRLTGLPDDLTALDRLVAGAQRGALVLPALAGLAAPYWDARAEGVVSGVTLHTDKAELARGFLEGVAFLLGRVVAAAGPIRGRRRVLASGGLSVVRTLLQAQADYLGEPVSKCRMQETSAWGAALLAGVGAGCWREVEDAVRVVKPVVIFRPTWSRRQLAQRCRSWEVLVGAARELGSYAGVNHSG
jgi:glycerol kinase